MPNVDEQSGGTAIAFSGANQLYQDATYPIFTYTDGATYPGSQSQRAYYRYDSPTVNIAVSAGSGTVTLFIGADVNGAGATYRVTLGSVTSGDVPFAYRKKITVSYTAAAARTISVTLNRGTNSNAGVFAVAVRPLAPTTRSYYFAGSQRVAMRVQGDPVAANNGVFYFVADHPAQRAAASRIRRGQHQRHPRCERQPDR